MNLLGVDSLSPSCLGPRESSILVRLTKLGTNLGLVQGIFEILQIHNATKSISSWFGWRT